MLITGAAATEICKLCNLHAPDMRVTYERHSDRREVTVATREGDPKAYFCEHKDGLIDCMTMVGDLQSFSRVENGRLYVARRPNGYADPELFFSEPVTRRQAAPAVRQIIARTEAVFGVVQGLASLRGEEGRTGSVTGPLLGNFGIEACRLFNVPSAGWQAEYSVHAGDWFGEGYSLVTVRKRDETERKAVAQLFGGAVWFVHETPDGCTEAMVGEAGILEAYPEEFEQKIAGKASSYAQDLRRQAARLFMLARDNIRVVAMKPLGPDGKSPPPPGLDLA